MAARKSRSSGGGYDPAKDEIVHVFWKKKTGDTRGERLVLRRYNGGAVKLAFEEVWQDRASGEIRSKVARCPASVLVEAGILDPEGQIAAGAAAPSEPSPQHDAFEL